MFYSAVVAFQADDLFPLVDTPQEAVLDAKVIRHLTSLCRQFAESVSTNAQTFEPTEYADKLAEQLGVATDGTNGVLDFGLEHWTALGNIVIWGILTKLLNYLVRSVGSKFKQK